MDPQLALILNQLITFKNNIVSTSKKIFQLPGSTAGQKYAAVWNATSNQTEKFDLSAALDPLVNLSDDILTEGEIIRVGDTFTHTIGFTWRIGGVNYANPDAIDLTPTAASTGNYRTDISVVDTSNNIYLIMGVESPTIAEQPQPDPNTLFLRKYNIFEGEISDPEEESNHVVVNFIATRIFAIPLAMKVVTVRADKLSLTFGTEYTKVGNTVVINDTYPLADNALIEIDLS